MSSTVLLHLVTYAAAIAFLTVIVIRFIRMNSMPMHLRWELYPVAHEPGAKAKYGGSHLEEIDWWTKPKESSTVNELLYMIPEMLFLVALFEHNRKLWWRSFPFHFGLYFLLGTIGLIAFGAILELVGIPVTNGENASMIGMGIFYLPQISGVIGMILTAFGSIGLLHMRLTDPDLSDYTPVSAIFNLILFLAVLFIAWITFIFIDPTYQLTRAYIQSLFTFNFAAPLESTLLGIEILLSVLLIAYIPMTHMAHFFLKWFTYHQIRWDDEAYSPGSKLEKKIFKQVQYPVTWSAPHLKADGKKNWLDIATEEIDEK